MKKISTVILLGFCLANLLWAGEHRQTPLHSRAFTTQNILQFFTNTAQISTTSFLIGGLANPRVARGNEVEEDCICGVKKCSCAVKNGVSSWYDPANERIFDTLHGSFIPADSYRYLPTDLKDCNIVAVGEIHSNPVHHHVEFEVLKTLSALRTPANVAIGLECFYRQHQKALDRFVFLHQDISKLKYETNWDDTWGYDLNFYAKMFKFAAANKIRLVGLNLPIQVAKLVSSAGLDAVPEPLKSILPPVDLTDQRHKKQFLESLHSSAALHMIGDKNTLERLYQTQTLWDEYMAETASKFVTEYPSSTLLVIAGINHIKGRTGIPNRIEKRLNVKPFVIVPEAVEWSPESGLPIIKTPSSTEDGDWVWYTQKEISKPT